MTVVSRSVNGLVGTYSPGDFYSFVVPEAEEVNIDLFAAFSDAILTLYNGAGSSITTADALYVGDNGWINRVLQPGTYYVGITAITEAAYTLTASVGTLPVGTATSNDGGPSLPNAVAAGVLSSEPETFLGWVGTGNLADWYSFNVSGLAQLQLTVAGLSSSVSVNLTNASGQILRSALFGSQSSNASINQVLAPLVPGNYYIELTGSSSTGFNLSLAAPPVPTSGGTSFATAEQFGVLGSVTQTASGDLSAENPDSYYSFNVAVASRVSLVLSGLVDNVDVTLYNAAGDEIATTSGGYNGGNSLIQSLAPLTAGTYFIGVAAAFNSPDLTNEQTPYTLSVASAPIINGSGNTPATAQAVGSLSSTPTTFTGFVGATNPAYYYEISLPSAEILDVGVSTLSGYGGNLAYFLLTNSSEQQIGETYSASAANAGLVSYTLQAGTYYVEVEQNSGDTNYTVGFSTGAPALGTTGVNIAGTSRASAKNIGTLSTAAAAFAGWVGPGNTDDYYEFTLSAPSLVNLAVTGESSTVTEILEDISGDSLTSASAGRDEFLTNVWDGASLTPELAAGTYYLDVSGSTSTGYNLSVSATALPQIAGSTLATATNIGTLGSATQTFSGAIAPVSPTNDFEFTLASTSRITLGLSGINVAGGATLELDNISGANIGTYEWFATYDYPAYLLQTLAPGTYFISILNGYQPTTYTLTASATPVSDTAGETLGAATSLGVLAPPSTVTISGTVADQTTTDAASLLPFSKATVSDSNVGQTETVTVTLSAAANGTLSNLGGGSYNASTGVYTDTGSVAAVTSALDGLVFTPTPHQVAPGQTVMTGFTVAASDTAGETASDSTTTVVATAVRSTPTISGTQPSQNTTDIVPITLFSGVTIADANIGQTETVTVTLSAAANGTVSNLGGGNYNASTGVYTDTGTAAAVTAALKGLLFVPTVPESSPGQTMTTDFTIAVTDTAGATASDSTTTVTVTIPPTTTISDDQGTEFAQVGSEFFITPPSGQGAVLKYDGSPVTAAGFGASIIPVGVVKTALGYEVAWSLGGNQFIFWNTDSNGNFTGDATGMLSGASYALQSLETTFDQDLNSDGTIGVKMTPIASNATTDLVQAANEYELNPASGRSGPILQYGGNAVTEGEFGSGIVPVGAVKTANGFEVAWSLGGNEFIVWNTDSNGNYTGGATGVLSGSGYALQSLETTFGEDLNSDGTIGVKMTPIASNGTTDLVQAANEYELNPASGGSGPILQYGGNAVTVGEFGPGIVPVGAVKTANGFEVAWALGGNDFIIWNTDSNGHYLDGATGELSGAGNALQSLEATFGEDLNNDGTIGPKITPIANNGTTSLVQAANEYELNTGSGGSGPILQFGGTAVTAGEFGAGIAPVGAVKTANGYEVAWSLGGDDFIVWNTDSNGNYLDGATGVLSGTSYALQSLETSFGEDLNDDGTIGPRLTPIASNGTTALVQAANEFELNPVGGANGPILQYGGNAVTEGEFGAGIMPVGAAKTATGYEVAWSLGGDEFIVWNTDSNSNFTSGATGVMSGASEQWQALEVTFGLGGGIVVTPLANNGTTTLAQAGNEYELNPSSGGGNGPLLQYDGNVVTEGEFGAGIVPVGAVKTASGYEVAWSLGGDQFIVWNTDSSGNYTGGATGVVSGHSFALEDLEPTFGEDLNGDGKLSTVLVTSPGAGNTLDLTSQTQPTTINLGSNTASASAGLDAPSLSFIGTPDAITLGASSDIVEYATSSGSGIETIANFVFGRDELNIDLMGASNSNLVAYNTQVNGQAAIAFASSADASQGVVVLNVSGQTAASVMSSHTSFEGGHALIS